MLGNRLVCSNLSSASEILKLLPAIGISIWSHTTKYWHNCSWNQFSLKLLVNWIGKLTPLCYNKIQNCGLLLFHMIVVNWHIRLMVLYAYINRHQYINHNVYWYMLCEYEIEYPTQERRKERRARERESLDELVVT